MVSRCRSFVWKQDGKVTRAEDKVKVEVEKISFLLWVCDRFRFFKDSDFDTFCRINSKLGTEIVVFYEMVDVVKFRVCDEVLER